MKFDRLVALEMAALRLEAFIGACHQTQSKHSTCDQTAQKDYVEFRGRMGRGTVGKKTSTYSRLATQNKATLRDRLEIEITLRRWGVSLGFNLCVAKRQRGAYMRWFMRFS